MRPQRAPLIFVDLPTSGLPGAGLGAATAGTFHLAAALPILAVPYRGPSGLPSTPTASKRARVRIDFPVSTLRRHACVLPAVALQHDSPWQARLFGAITGSPHRFLPPSRLHRPGAA